MSKPCVIDLFCGAGGLALGFHKAGFETVRGIDLDEAAIETFNVNFGRDGQSGRTASDGRPIGIAAPIEHVTDFPNADVIVGGPPCQGFSLLGLQHRRVLETTTGEILKDPRNMLWREYLRVVRDVEPLAFVMENVAPMLKAPEFDAFEDEIAADGYQIVKGVLLAADYGVPQRRHRAIVIGSRVGRPFLPWPTHAAPASDSDGRLLRDSIWVEGGSFLDRGGRFGPTELSEAQHGRLRPWRTVRDAFQKEGRPLPLAVDNRNWHVGRNPRPESLERYSHIPPGGNRFDLPEHLKPDCWKRKVSGSTDLFGRLEWDKPSLTIRTEFFKPEKGRYLHPEADRPITHREAMRLQTFPDEFKWAGSRIQVARQVGNAVPCHLALHVALAVRRLIDGTSSGQSAQD